MISSLFYETFKAYKYLLIYQLDSYVFRDELPQWGKKGYAYIGAPWFENDNYGKMYLKDVGNGGFSFRDTRKSLKVLKQLRYKEVFERYKYFNWKGLIPKIPQLLIQLHRNRNTASKLEMTFKGHEDDFWCRAAPIHLKNFNCNSRILSIIYHMVIKNDFPTPPPEEALKFSFEVNPRTLFDLNNKCLPFGCHAWEKKETSSFGKTI